MANENYGQFLDGGVLRASDFLAGYRPPGVAGAEVRISGANILSYIQANITTGVAWGGITGLLSNQTDLQTALNLLAPLASPALTGVPTAPTAAPGTNTTQLATTAFVKAALPVQYNQPQIIGLTGGGATNLDGLSLTGFVVNSAIGITVAGAFHTWVLMSGNQATAIDAGTQTGIVQPVAQTAVYWQTLA